MNPISNEQQSCIVPFNQWRDEFINMWNCEVHKSAIVNLFEEIENKQKKRNTPLNFYIVNDERVKFSDGDETIGGFEQFNDEFVICLAVKGKDREELLEFICHEYCHFLQELDAIFNNRKIILTEVDKIITNSHEAMGIEVKSKFEKRDVLASYKRMIEHEYDCNLRVLDIIKSLRLPLDYEKTCKRMNAYHLFHYAAFYKGRWYRNDPAKVTAVLDTVESTLTTPQELESQFEENMFKECF
ncbi:hypothetical protein [Halobacteriovorax sp. DA5]|uniref:hypothetical protein n=1 Tax=Halobacteriovorax sp. DA5 TaxID=2067553 RepID=UPI000CD07506|nr:hypothetical protein [Halobacteriovorax sp. DA5]POB13617.1 hypothetical protein C0Z22_10660 [Halobacteriovorax sp. DA5]